MSYLRQQAVQIGTCTVLNIRGGIESLSTTALTVRSRKEYAYKDGVVLLNDTVSILTAKLSRMT